MLDLQYKGMGIRARVCVSSPSSYLYIISMDMSDHLHIASHGDISVPLLVLSTFSCMHAARAEDRIAIGARV